MLEIVPFNGFGEDATAWFAGLAADNSKAYLDRTRTTFERSVRDPLNALLHELAGEFGGHVKLFRQNRDIRFSNRGAVADDKRGKRLEKIVAEVRERGLDVVGEKLKTVPRGYARDHSRASLLAHKDLIAGAMLPADPALHDRRAYDFTAETWRAAEPLVTWLDRHVGRSTIPPEKRSGRR